MPRVKTLDKNTGVDLSNYPNFSKTGSIRGMKERYYGKDSLLVKSGPYIYNVTSDPDIYFEKSH